MPLATVSAMGLSQFTIGSNSLDRLADWTADILSDRSLRDGVFILAIRDAEDTDTAVRVRIEFDNP